MPPLHSQVTVIRLPGYFHILRLSAGAHGEGLGISSTYFHHKEENVWHSSTAQYVGNRTKALLIVMISRAFLYGRILTDVVE